MTDFGGATIGERIALYRKLNRLSRDQLADATNGVVGRDVIANIENGRRKDISVSQMVALSTALCVPPTALMFDITRPLESVEGPEIAVLRSVSNGEESVERRKPRLSEILTWYSVEWSLLTTEDSPAGMMVMRQVDAWRDYISKFNQLSRRMDKYEGVDDFENEPDKKARLEIGGEIVRAWSAHRHAVSMGVVGLREPPVPERLADHFLEGGVVSLVDPSEAHRLLDPHG